MASFSSYKSEHHYATGLVLVAVGVLGMAGSITGSLAAMLAALFTDPSTTLYNVKANSTPPVDDNPFSSGYYKNILNPWKWLTNPGG